MQALAAGRRKRNNLLTLNRLPVGEEIDRGGDKAGRLDGPHTDRFSQIAADGSG